MEIDDNILLIFLLQIISIIFSVIEQKPIQLILNIVLVILIIVHVVLININKLILISKIIIFIELIVSQFFVYGQAHFWIVIYICNLNKNFVIMNQIAVISLLVFEVSSFKNQYEKSFLQTIFDIALIILFDIYNSYKVYVKIQQSPIDNEFIRIFNQNHQELPTKIEAHYFTTAGNKTTMLQLQSQEIPHYQIYQIQDSIPSFKDLFCPEWKKTYYCSTTEDLLQIYDKESSHLFYILFFSTGTNNQKEVFKVQISRDKKQQYILTYKKLDSLLYQKMKMSKKKFRQNLGQIFSHKLKTPLNSALAKITQILTDKSVLNEQKEILSQIYIQQKCQLYSILDFLDYVNGESLTCQPQKVTLNQIVFTARDLIREQCKAKQINLKITIDDFDYKDFKDQIFINTDSLKLERVLYNLLNNAYRHSNQNGTIILKINITQGKIHFSIKDSGKGMTREMMDDYNLQFAYYVKSLSTIKRSWNHKLGTTLMVTNKIIHLLSGYKDQLSIPDSEESEFTFSILQEINMFKGGSDFGVGSLSSDRSEHNIMFHQQNQVDEIQEEEEIIGLEPQSQQLKQSAPAHKPSYIVMANQQQQSITLPLIQSKHSQNPYSNNYNRSSSIFDVNSFLRQFSYKDQGGADSNQELVIEKELFIGIVDDEPFNHDTLVMMLKRIGYTQFLHAFNGLDCLAQVKENNSKIKLVLMDLDMPIMNGLKATESLIEMMRQKKIKPLPIIACTAHDDIDTIQKCKQIGMFDVIIKPVFLKQLQNTLKTIPKNFESLVNFEQTN